MATITQRIAQGAPSGYDQGLLLEYKEAFLYPLPASLLSWNELRIAFRVGLYPNTGDYRSGNGWPGNIPNTNSSKTSSPLGDLTAGKMFFGLKNSNNYLMPFESGDSRFVGYGVTTGDRGIGFECNGFSTTVPPRCVYFDSTDTTQYFYSLSITSGNTLGTKPTVQRFNANPGTNNAAFAFPPPSDVASTGRYSEMFALRYSRIGSTGYNFAIWKNFTNDSQSDCGTPYQTTDQLRSFMNSINSSDTTRYINFTNFFYTNSGSENGSIIPFPDALFAYYSNTGFRLIIYDFIVEKIS